MAGTLLQRALPFVSLFVLAALTTSCDMETGPELIVDVIDEESGQVVAVGGSAPLSMLEPTTDDSSQCCCVAVGRAQNLSTVAVHTTLKFEAYRRNADGTEEKIGAAVDFIKDLSPNEIRPVNAVGFLIPCDSIDSLSLVDVDKRGLWTP
jgi:hypothetical protein